MSERKEAHYPELKVAMEALINTTQDWRKAQSGDHMITTEEQTACDTISAMGAAHYGLEQLPPATDENRQTHRERLETLKLQAEKIASLKTLKLEGLDALSQAIDEALDSLSIAKKVASKEEARPRGRA